jgi:hypothetical protein
LLKSEKININKLPGTEEGINVTVWKLTALWAFSEAALGGILHAFKIPFRGVFVGGSAAILISLIAYFSEQKGTILKSTLLVILIKGMVSPHTPVTAYFAVFLQGFLGEVLFYKKSFFKISALTLGILTLLFSSTQKIIIYTVVFGNTLWESIDQFASFVVNKFIMHDNVLEFRFSYLLVTTYLSVHIILGIFIGIFAGKLPFRIIDVMSRNSLDINSYNYINSELIEKKKRKHKRWWQRPSGIILFSFAAVMVVLSYVNPELGSNKAYEIMIMVLRAVVIMLIWYTIVGPVLLKYLRKYFKKKQNLYSTELTKIFDAFPQLRTLVSRSWKVSSTEKGYRKIKSFITHLIAFLLLSDLIDQ